MPQFELVDAFVNVDDEDSMTKAVFGSFELLSPQALTEVFDHTTVDIRFETVPKFTFHETVQRREPDVIIEDGKHLTVMVEAKLGAPTEMSQLVDEYADLTDNWNSDELQLLHVTDDTRPPPKLQTQSQIPGEHLQWTSWRQLAAALRKVDATLITETDRRVLAMLTEIFEDNGFLPFGGFTIMNESENLSDQLEKAYEARNKYYEEINAFRKDSESRMDNEIRFWRFFRRGVSGGMTGGQKSFPQKGYQRMPKHLWFSYIPREEKPELANRNYLQNYLTVDFNSKTGTIRAGYIMTTASGRVEEDIFRKTLHEHKDTIINIIQEHEFQPFTTSYSLSTRIDPSDDIDAFLDVIGDPGYDTSEWGKRFMLAKSWSAESLPTKGENATGFEEVEETTDVASAINDIHQLTYNKYDHIFYPTLE